MSQGSNRVVNDLGKRLLEAARQGDTDQVHKLMSNGAPLTTDWLGTTPLHLASIYGHTSTAEVLIKSGISRDGRTKVDKAPLHFACQHGHVDIVKLLLSGGAHVNATDMLKMTPLHWAVEANNFEICLLLLKAGVKTELKNKFDKTPLRIASDNGYHSIAQLLGDDKLKVLQDIDVLQQTALRNQNVSSVKICRPEDSSAINITNQMNNNLVRKQKTKRFPMVAGTWAGGEAQSLERIELNERKKLGNFKRRSSSLQQPPVIETKTPSIGSLHLTTSNVDNLLSPTTPSKSTENDQRSPLQQLVDAVRQSTYIKNEETDQLKDVSAGITCSKEGATFLHNNSSIPIISSLALKSLPPNIKAIPLGIKAESNITIPRAAAPAGSAFANQSETSTPTTATAGTAHTSKEKTKEELTAAVNLPIELLNQIINGDIKLHSMPGKSKDTSLVAINTEMGTIPIIPVKGEGGLQLIPIEREGEPKRVGGAATAPMMHQAPIRLISNHPNHHFPFPFTPAAVPSPSTFGGSLMQSKVTTSQPGVPSPMLLPTGIYLQPGHPAFFQVQRSPSPAISMLPSSYSPRHPRIIPAGQFLQPTPPFLVHPSAAAGQPTFIQPQIPSPYVYVEREEGK